MPVELRRAAVATWQPSKTTERETDVTNIQIWGGHKTMGIKQCDFHLIENTRAISPDMK